MERSENVSFCTKMTLGFTWSNCAFARAYVFAESEESYCLASFFSMPLAFCCE